MIIGWKNIAPRLQRNLTEAALSGAKIIEQILMDTEAVDYEKWPLVPVAAWNGAGVRSGGSGLAPVPDLLP